MSPELFEAINSPLQVSGLTMRAFAAPFKGTAPNASVLVGVELLGRDLSLEANSKVDVSFMAVDAKAKVLGARNDVADDEPAARDAGPAVEQIGFRVLNRMELPAGRYQLRIAARDSGKAHGRVDRSTTSTCPDFYKQPFSISGLAHHLAWRRRDGDRESGRQI